MSIHHVVCALLLIAIGLSGILLPLLRYVTAGWHAKRKDIMDGLDAAARLHYFHMFARSDPQPPNEAAAFTLFEKLYTRWYGQHFFTVPGLLLGVTTLVAVTLVVFTGMDRLAHTGNPFLKLPDTAMAAVGGAYLWVANDFIARARRLDFSPSDVMWGVLRLVIAVPMGYAFATIAPKQGAFIAFALGAFPLSELIALLRRLADKALDSPATAAAASDDIIKLQGVNKSIQERLANEDITTVTQIAYCDPVRLTMRSSLQFIFITDCMNQALAWLYLEETLAVIRPLGLRGACEIRCMIMEMDDASKPVEAQRARDAFVRVAQAAHIDEAALQNTFRQIAEDPFTEFLAEIWT